MRHVRQPCSQPINSSLSASGPQPLPRAPNSVGRLEVWDRRFSAFGPSRLSRAVIGRPPMIELVDHLGLVERHVASARLGRAALQVQAAASRPPASASAAWRGRAPSASQSVPSRAKPASASWAAVRNRPLSEVMLNSHGGIHAPRIARLPFGLVDQHGDAGVDLRGQLGVGAGAEDRGGFGVRVDRGDVSARG